MERPQAIPLAVPRPSEEKNIEGKDGCPKTRRAMGLKTFPKLVCSGATPLKSSCKQVCSKANPHFAPYKQVCSGANPIFDLHNRVFPGAILFVDP